MLFFEKFRNLLPKDKTKDELDTHYDKIQLEKGDLLAMLIAGFITFLPLILLISFIYIGIALLFF